MPSARITTEALEFLWRNYQILAENVDLEAMTPGTLAEHAARKSPVRPFRIAAWLGRQAFFIASWSLWEHYSRELCDSLPEKAGKGKRDSHVDWVRKSMAANRLAFSGHEWFASANRLRNLLAHFAGRAVEPRAQKLFELSHGAFPDLETYTDGYVALTHCHVADLEGRIEEFIEETAQRGGRADPRTSGGTP